LEAVVENPLNKPLLLAIVASLLLIKWGVQPVLDWQQQVKLEIEQDYLNLQKTRRIIQAKSEFEQQANELRSIENNLTLRFAAQTADFQINTQRQIEELFKTLGIKIESFSWLSQSDRKYGAVSFQVQISGKLEDFMSLQLKLRTNNTPYTISEYRVRRKSTRDADIENLQGTLNVSVFVKED
jgi:hypothetical protein